jgi:hypothetical protein
MILFIPNTWPFGPRRPHNSGLTGVVPFAAGMAQVCVRVLEITGGGINIVASQVPGLFGIVNKF